MKTTFSTFVLVAIILSASIFYGCGEISAPKYTPQSNTGVTKVTATVKTGNDHMTIEQRNVKKRLELENEPGAIQYLYVLNSFSGQVMFSDIVAGKVTSSSKRLTPTEIESAGEYLDGFPVTIGNWSGTTAEVLGDDGTYGSSVNYIFWFSSVSGAYRQMFMTGGQQVLVSSQPIPIKNMTLSLETSTASSAP